MNRKINNIPNPNKISDRELDFLKESSKIILTKSSIESNDANKYKGRMISMSDDFFSKLNSYLKDHPTEGNRSSFIVRIVSDYIDRKHKV